MTTLTSDSLAALLASGERVRCARCGAICRASSDACFTCHQTLHAEPEQPQPAPKTKRRTSPAGTRYAAGRKNSPGTLADLPGLEFVLVVPGVPESQGSMKAIAAGVMRHSNPKTVAWRDKITRAALLACGPDWAPADVALTVSVTFTVPEPANLPARWCVPSRGHRDLDKLQRAVGDALCPSDTTRFRLYSSDMLIEHWDARRTNPRPNHTHPDALEEPGVVIRVRVTDPKQTRLPQSPLPVTTTWKAANHP